LIKTPIYKSIWGAWSVVWESYAPRGDGTGSQLVRRFDIARTSNAMFILHLQKLRIFIPFATSYLYEVGFSVWR